MIKFDRNSWFFLNYTLCLLTIFNLALFFHIPLILPVSGIIVLGVLPGYLLCLVLGIRVQDPWENFLYRVGLSISFDLIFGLSINALLPVFGIHDPLSLPNLQTGFSIIMVILISLVVSLHKAPEIDLRLPKFLKIEKILLCFALSIVIGILAGIYLVNYDISNLVLMVSVSLIPLLLALVIFYHTDAIKRIYPVILSLLSFSLLLLLELRSNYIIGIDMHQEYYFFYTTLSQSVWIPDPSYLLSSSISISILPTVFEQFLGIDPQLLFKLMYPLLFSTAPLIIYVIAKKYVDELLAVFASCFYMFQVLFISSSDTSRTFIGILFFAFAVLVLCDSELKIWKRHLMFMVFIAVTIFSHYTSAFMFIGIILLAYLIDLMLSTYETRRSNRFISLSLIFYFAVLAFFWYQQIINFVFSTSVESAIFRSTIFLDFLQKDATQYIYPALTYSSFLWHYTRYTQALFFLVMGIGILFILFSWTGKGVQQKSYPEIIVNINRNLFFFGLVSVGILFLIVFAPFLFYDYDTMRAKGLIDIVLSVFLVIGAWNIVVFLLQQEKMRYAETKFHRKLAPWIAYVNSRKTRIISGILLFLLIPNLLFAAGITYQIDRVPYKITLNSPKISENIEFGFNYIYDQDAGALHWFDMNTLESAQIFSDKSGNGKISSVINRKSSLYEKSITDFSDKELKNGYIFLTVINEYFDVLKDPAELEGTKLSQYRSILYQKNKIFSNGAVLYK